MHTSLRLPPRTARVVGHRADLEEVVTLLKGFYREEPDIERSMPPS